MWQASAQSMRQKAQGIEADTAFLQEEADPQDEAAKEAAELAAAERLYQKQLAKELGVSILQHAKFGLNSLSFLPCSDCSDLHVLGEYLYLLLIQHITHDSLPTGKAKSK